MTEPSTHARWKAFLNDCSKTQHGCEARMEIMGRDVGAQDVATWLPATAWVERPSLTGRFPCTGISSDPRHHQIFVTVGGISSHDPVHLTHPVDSPRTMAVRSTPAGEGSALRMMSGEKTETLMTLRRQPQLAT